MSAATPFSVKINAITQKDGNRYTGLTDLVSKFTAQLSIFNLEKKKDVNGVEIKDSLTFKRIFDYF